MDNPEYPFGKLPHDDITPEAYRRSVEGILEAADLDPMLVNDYQSFDAHLGLLGADLFALLKSKGTIDTLDISYDTPQGKIQAEDSKYKIEVHHSDGQITKMWSSGEWINVSREDETNHKIIYKWSLPVTEKDYINEMSISSVTHENGTKQYNPMMKDNPESWHGYVKILQKTFKELSDAKILDNG